jgi:hypothetical protein
MDDIYTRIQRLRQELDNVRRSVQQPNTTPSDAQGAGPLLLAAGIVSALVYLGKRSWDVLGSRSRKPAKAD